MPRAVDPRSGEVGFETEPEQFAPERETTLDILERSGLSLAGPDIVRLTFDLADIRTCYHRWKGRGAASFTRAEARESIDQVLRLDTISGVSLCSLNGRAEAEVHNELCTTSPCPAPAGMTIVAALDRDLINETVLRAALEGAKKRLTETKGPDRDADLAWCVQELCKVYEALFDRETTHWNRDGRLYSPEPGSPAGRFVLACMRVIDPKVPNHTISGCMRKYIEARPHAQE